MIIILASSLHFGQILVAVNPGTALGASSRCPKTWRRAKVTTRAGEVGPTLSQWPHGGNGS